LVTKSPVPGYELDDVVQTAWLRILKGIKSFRFRSQFETWVYRIVVNTHLEMLRSPNRIQVAGTDPDDGGGFNPPDPRPNPLQQVIRSEDEESFRAMIKKALLDIAPTRSTVQKWLKEYPEGLTCLSADFFNAIVKDISQHELAGNTAGQNRPSPEWSKILKNQLKNYLVK
jgi:hypothetical protein